MNNFDLKKFLVENKLTTNSKALSVSEAADTTPIMIDGKEIDEESVELGQDDFGNGEEYFVDKAKFVDGTELTIDQMQDLTDNHIERFAPDSTKYVGPSM